VKKCDRIIVPDNPKHTICEYNLGNLNEMGISDKVKFVGSFIDMTHQKDLKEEHVFAPISGPLGTRAKLAKMIIPAFSQLKSKCIISLGEPSEKIMRKIGNCEIYNWLTRKERNEFMKNAKMIVFSGGHGTCFEVIKHRKPSVCIPTQPEQMGNARKLEELKCSVQVENEVELKSAIFEIEEKRELVKAQVEKFSEYSSQFKGLENAVRVIETL
jgi:UDP:flavonoid glycosyltransferase YjiC (YdhE family)